VRVSGRVGRGTSQKAFPHGTPQKKHCFGCADGVPIWSGSLSRGGAILCFIFIFSHAGLIEFHPFSGG